MKNGGARGETLFVFIGAGCNYSTDYHDFMYLPSHQPLNSQLWLFDELQQTEIRLNIERHLSNWLKDGNRRHIRENVYSVEDIIENLGSQLFAKIIIISVTEAVSQLDVSEHPNMLFIYTGHTDMKYDLNNLALLDLSSKPILEKLVKYTNNLMVLYEIISSKVSETGIFSLDREHFIMFYQKYNRMILRFQRYSHIKGICEIIKIPLAKLLEISSDLNSFYNRKSAFLGFISKNSLVEDDAGFERYMVDNGINRANTIPYKWQCLVFPFTHKNFVTLCEERLVAFE
jgi:hypothetical protein